MPLFLFSLFLLTFFSGGLLEAKLPGKILVIGGAGSIGSYVNKLLNESGYDTVVLDNLCYGRRENVVAGLFIEGNYGDRRLLDRIFDEYPVSAVVHLAAYTDVGESWRNPGAYYVNNLCHTVTLLQAMVDHSVGFIVFSSSAAVYGSVCGYAEESKPCHPNNPYGRTKLFAEEILRDFAQAHALHYCALRYFNVVGGDRDGILKNYKTQEINLIPMALRSIKNDQLITIYGNDYPTKDGSCVRDYIHVYDLARAHLLALEKLFSGSCSTEYNLGSGRGFTVFEVLETIERLLGKKLNVTIGPRRPGDCASVLADSKKAYNELGWQPECTLECMILDAWNALP